MRRLRDPGRYIASALIWGTLALAQAAHADVDFIPTAEQWATWPAYCRASYTRLYARLLDDPSMLNQVSPSEIEQWNNQLGPVFLSVHHYCFALAGFQAASADSDAKQREFLLNQALIDVKFTYNRMDILSPLAPEVSCLYAQIENELGNVKQARDVLERIIQAQPNSDRPYLVLSLIARKQGNPTEAIETLEQANQMTDFKSAEVNYALGLLYFDRHDYVAARECADRAYALGYPLPGLNNKLRRVEH